MAHDDIYCPVVSDEQIHCMAEAFGERAPMVEPAVAIGIRQHADAITFWPFIFSRALMRMRLGNEQAALAIKRHTDRGYDLRRFGHELELVAAARNSRLGCQTGAAQKYKRHGEAPSNQKPRG